MRAKKYLGQHFLTSKQAVRDLIASADVEKHDTILEVGPGTGVLTHALLEHGATVVAIETDEDMVAILRKEFDLELSREQLTIVSADALETPLTETMLARWGITRYKVVANIPYYITGELVRRFLTAPIQPTSVTLLMQREVAERIARSRAESILSISVKAYGAPRYVSTVPARYFNPPPKVDSAIVHISDISRDFFAEVSEASFFKLVKAGFSSKRKKLINNLAAYESKERLAKVFAQCGISPDTRAEQLSVEAWRELALTL